MGSVYRAFDTKLQRQVALKVLPPRLATPDAIGRFRREAFVALQLRHDHVVTSFEFAQHGSLHFLAMELVDGPSLSAHLAKPTWGWPTFFGPQAQAGGPDTRTGQFMGTIDYCSSGATHACCPRKNA